MDIVKSVIVTVLASAVIASAQAGSESSPGSITYLGASGGQSDFGDACDGMSSCDDTDTAWKVFMGVHKKNFGFEVGFINLGEADATHPVFGKIKTDDVFGGQAQGVGILPVSENFSGFAKVGGLIYDGDEINEGVTWALGVGAQYDITNTFSVRAEYEWFADISDLGDTSFISAGLVFNFN